MTIKRRLALYTEICRRWRFPSNYPDFMVVGAQKSGTSSLHYYLQQHPDITGSLPKEVHYFDRDVFCSKPLAQYRTHFRGSTSQCYFESTPAYMYRPGALENIKATSPGIKLIAILRDPVSRAYSAWNHYRYLFHKNRGRRLKRMQRRQGNQLYEALFTGRSEFPSFSECLTIELRLMEENPSAFEPALLRRGLYDQQVDRLFSLFPEEQVLLIPFSKLCERPLLVVNQVVDFLDLPPLDADLIDLTIMNNTDYSSQLSLTDLDFLAQFFGHSNENVLRRLGWDSF